MRLALLSIALFLSTVVTAQLDSKVTTGAVHFHQGNYDQALETLNLALSDTGSLKPKNIPKAYYYRGKTRESLMQQYDSGDPEATVQYYDLALGAYQDFVNAKKTDDGRLGGKIQTELEMLFHPLLEGGLTFLNSSSAKSLEEKTVRELNEHAMIYLDACIAIKPANYIAYDLRAQAEYNLDQNDDAYKDFIKAKDLFNEEPPKKPDLLIGYVYYRLALIDRYTNKSLTKALTHVKEGLKTVHEEWKRLLPDSASYDQVAWSGLELKYRNAIKDLESLKLDIYLNYPPKRNEALKEFAEAVKEQPDNYSLFVAYASLLEYDYPDKAADMYRKAIKIDPNNELAYFNLGALLSNQAHEFFQAANGKADYREAEALRDKGDEKLREAMPYFEKCVEINPDNTEAITALKQIYTNLNLMDKYERIEH